MKKSIFSVVAALLLIAASACSSFSNRGEVDRPLIGSASQEALSIEKVVLTDSATVLHAVVHFRPHWWIEVSDSSSITANDKKYFMTGIDGITPNEHVYMPDSGVIHFTMTFPAIPASAKSIDFTEETPTGWKLFDIDLTGKADHNMNLSSLPSELRNPTNTDEFPEPDFSFGDSTIVNIHLLGYIPEKGFNNLSYAINTLHGQYSPEKTFTPDANGNLRISTMLSAPAYIFIINEDTSTGAGSTHLAPGEEVDIYIDTHISGVHNMAVRDGVKAFPEGFKPSYSTGRYSGLNSVRGKNYYMQIYSGDFADYHMNGDQYTDHITGLFKALRDSIEADPELTAAGKRYWKALITSNLVYATTEAKQTIRRNYYNTHNNWGEKIPADSINFELSKENVQEIAKLIDFNNPDLLFANEVDGLGETDVWKNAGVDPGMFETIRLYNIAYDAANNVSLTEEQIAPLRKANKALADEVEAHQKAQKAVLDALDKSLITPTPEVADSKLFDAIVAPHKGKVVMVDFWNTWCGPCRAALEENEPEKSGDLSTDDIVWIYIADESSPMPKYLNKIKEIRGIHYRVTEDQIAALRKQFDVDGIPYYVLVDRNGKATGRPDLRDHSLFKKTLLEEVAK